MFSSSARRFLGKLVREKPIYLLTSLVLSSSSVTLDVAGKTLIIPVLIILFGNGDRLIVVEQPAIIESLFSWVYQIGKYRLEVIAALIFFLFVFQKIVEYTVVAIELKYTKYLAYHLKSWALDFLCRVNIDYFQQNKTQDILVKYDREIDKTVLLVNSGRQLLITTVNILLLTGLLFFIFAKLTLLVLIFLSLTVFINSYLSFVVKKRTGSLSQKRQLLTRQLLEFLTGIRLHKIADREFAQYQTITRSLEEKNRLQLNTQLVLAMGKPITEIIIMLMLLVSIVFSRMAIQNADFSIYLVILFCLLPLLDRWNNARIQFVNAIPSLEIVTNFLTAANQPISSGKTAFTRLKTRIEFRDVTFAYPQQAPIILDELNLWVLRGKTVALIGLPGSGKTIADLLTRFYEPTQGQILLDGKELKEYKLTQIRKAIAIVSSTTFLFNSSIAENIAYGIENVTEADLVTATKKAKLYGFIERLPEGFATQIGDREMVLTEEQKQKIAIARAFLRNPQILILNEPTALLNSGVRESVQRIIELLSRDRTTLLITRQLSLAKKADRIVVFNQGKVIESGTHQELLQQGNIYQRLYLMQFKSSRQSHRQLAKKIAQKLASQTKRNLSTQIRSNLNSLLNYLQLIDEGLFEGEQQENQILDESYKSAKHLLASLQEYERKIARKLKNTNL